MTAPMGQVPTPVHSAGAWLSSPLPAAVAAVLAHLLALGNGLVWLDHLDVEHGAALVRPSAFGSLFTHGYAETGFYRPLVSLSLSIEAMVGTSGAFHLGSLMLHGAAAAAVVAAARALGAAGRGASLAGVLFAVHPATSIVANLLVARGDALATTGLLTMVWALATDRAALAAAAVLLGAGSKETALALTVPFAWVALGRPRLERRWVAVLAAFAVGLGARLAFGPAWRSQWPALAWPERVGTQLSAVAQSAWGLVDLFQPRVCDAIAVVSPSSPHALAGAAVLLALAAFAWRRRGTAMLLAFSVVPMLGLVPLPRLWSPQYLYLPLAAAAVVAAPALGRLGARAQAAVWVAAATLAAFSLVDAHRWRDDLALFGPEVAQNRQCREAQLYLGDALSQTGQLPAAVAAYQAATTPAPGWVAYSDDAAAFQNLGLAQLALGQHAEAELALLEAQQRQTHPRHRRELTYDLAAVALARGDPRGAELLLAPEVARADALPGALALLARALRAMGREEEADVLLHRLEKGPSSP